VECLGVAAGAGLGQWLRATLARRRLNQLGVTLMAGMVACLVYLGVTGLLMTLGVPSARHAAGYTSAVLFLIPGFPLITAALDLARLDFSAGIARLTYAVLIITVASISAWLVAELVHLVPLRAPALDLPESTLLTLRLVAGFCGVLGFAIMFNTPLRIALAAACIGMLANTLRLYLADVQVPLQVAAPIATLLVGLLAAWVSTWMKCPRIVLSVPPVLIMIPGATAYQALVYANQEMPLEAIANAYQAMFIVAGIAIGLAIARMLTDRAWAFEGRLPGAVSK
ncbi:threonine/serine exporter family protein, partial [Thiocystis violacea]|uniref:threonine/serine exporter family protein n=1 Tax=Thiocystis violacea TaxID=13725 RepID=UPI001905C008